MRSFDYVAPASMEGLLQCLTEHSTHVKVLAGGTDLLVAMMLGKVRPRLLVSLKNLHHLRELQPIPDGLTIGAACTLSAVETSSLLGEPYQFLRQTIADMASIQVRNRGTLGGNLCNASPAADTAGPLMVLGARAVIRGLRGERRVPVEDLWLGPGQVAAAPDEVLTAVEVPRYSGRWAGCYVKVGRTRSMDLGVAGVAVFLALDDGGAIHTIRVALSSVAEKPIRAHPAESALTGIVPTQSRLEEAARLAAGCARPITDVRASALYRREMVRVLTRRAVSQALHQVGGRIG